MKRILIDADGCPVVDLTLEIAGRYGVECVLLCDTAHYFQREGAKTITVAKGPDSVDFVLVNMLTDGDLVVTQDYGLAAMCIARGAAAIHQNGMLYDDSNMDALLLARHTARKIRNAGGRLKGSSKRTADLDQCFAEKLEAVLRGEACSIE